MSAPIASASADRAPDYLLVKREVSALLGKYDIDEPPVDPVRLARNEGLGVRFVSFAGDYSAVSGFYDPGENAIYVNEDEYPLRQTFTIAHELGHAKLHRDWAASADYSLLWRDQSKNADDFHEKEANAFAAHLLVPRKFLEKYYRTLTTEQLSRIFAVSVPVIKNRISFEYGI
ncbi:MAG: ImmA/IrrE family metallo-endopeptidase [Pseudomonadota bacterium]